MNQIKIKDNTKVDKNSLTKISNLCGRIANKTLKQLENEGVFVFPEFILETDDLTKDQTILKSNGDTLYSGNVMGFLGCGNERLIIQSRFCEGKEDFFFQYMLEKVLDFPNIVDLETDADQNNRLFSFLLFLFPLVITLLLVSLI